MNRFLYAKGSLICLLSCLFAFCVGNNCLFAQCFTGSWSSNGLITPVLCDGRTPTNLSGCFYPGYSYDEISVTAGQTYTFTSNVGTDIITLSADSGQTAAQFGKGKVTWVSTLTGVVRMYVHIDTSCTATYDCRQTKVICGPILTCDMPVGGLTTSITPNSAVLNWLPPASLPSSGYQYYLSTSDTVPDNSTLPSGSTGAGMTNVTLSNLSPGTIYYAWVRSNCQANDQSYWVPLDYFSTLCYEAPMVTGGQRCGTGTVDLLATAESGSTIKWYAAATGRKALGSGNNFKTPLIANTTTFYAEAMAVKEGLVRMGVDGTITGQDHVNNPLSGSSGGNKTQMLFLASELQEQGLVAGNITSLSFVVAAINPAGVLNDFTIKLGATADTVLSSFIPGTTTVYNATYTPTSTGTITFPFSSPYPWDGSSNLVVETIHNDGGYGFKGGTFVAYSTTTNNSVFTVATYAITPPTADGFNAGISGRTGIASRLRPNVLLSGVVECGSPRVPVIASVTPGPLFSITEDKTVCNEEIRAISVTSPSAHYDQVSWQPATGLFTDPGATVPYVPNASAPTVYFKSNVVGTATYGAYGYHTTTACGATDTLSIQTLPASVATVAIKGLACLSGDGVFNLSPAIEQTGHQYQWQQSANNVTFADIGGATAASYTTPMVSNTQYYRAKVSNSDGVHCFYASSDSIFVSNPVVTKVTAAERCGPGTLQLAAEASADFELKWYTTATGGSPLGSGSVFQTPSINSTTTYYVGANAVVGGDTRTLGTGQHLSSSSFMSAGVSPFSTESESYKRQMLIRANELKALGFVSGYITSLAFDVVSVDNPAATFSNFKIKLIATSDTALTEKFLTGGTYVYEVPSVTPQMGLNTYHFTQPFYWDGSANIAVQVCHPSGTGGRIDGSGYAVVKYDSTLFTALSVYSGMGQDVSICEATDANYNGFPPLSRVRPKMVLGFDMLCESNRTAVVATVKALPPASISPNGAQRLCQEYRELTTTGGVAYAWLHNHALISGAKDSIFKASQDGAYRVIVTGANGCVDTSVVAQLSRMDVPVSLGRDTSICSGSSVTLDAGNAGTNYLWNNAATSRYITVAEAGKYYVTVTDSDDCSGSDTIVLSHFPVLTVDLGNDTGICQGATLTLDAGSGGAEYFWDNGALTRTRTVNRAGEFSIMLTDVYGCSYYDTIKVEMIPPPSGTINIQGDGMGGYTFSIDNAQHVSRAIWHYGDGQIGVGHSVKHSYTSNGNYTVTLLLINDCGDTVALNKEHQVKDVVGIDEHKLGAATLDLYPNPAHTQLYIKNEHHMKLHQVSIYNLLGRKVYEAKPGNNALIELNIGILPSGIYTIQVDTDKGRIGRKVEMIR